MKVTNANERTELKELKVMIIVSFLALVIMVGAAVEHYFSLSDYDVHIDRRITASEQR